MILKRFKRSHLVIGLLVPLMLVWGLYETPSEPNLVPTHTSADQPSSFATQLSVQRYDNTGKLYQAINSEHVRFFDAFEQTHFTSPEMYIYKTNGQTTITTSQTGVRNNQFNELVLAGTVLVQDNAETAGVKLTTERLTVNLTSQIADTNQPVEIRSNDAIYTSTGIRAWLGDSKMELLSDVQGIHETKP